MLCNFGPEKFEKVLNFERRFFNGTSDQIRIKYTRNYSEF